MIKLNRKIWLPVVLWLALFLFIFNITHFFSDMRFAFVNAAYETFINASMFYVTTKFLFPRFHKKGRKYFWISSIVFVTFAIIFTCVDHYLMPDFRTNIPNQPPTIVLFMRYIFSLGFVFFVATSLSLMEQTNKLMKSEKLLIEEKLATELKLLKAQINPHFIFNALNNIYSLTYMQSKNAPESVLKLSEMLRYVFYDCNKDRVPVSSELKYIENFIAFQQMKSEFAQNIKIESAVNGANIEIAPMLFIPFIENAFKYSRIEENESAFINIRIEHEHNKLHFNIKNTFPENNKPAPGSGMGIKNVKHRLDIIYPHTHKLHIEEKTNNYSVDLTLEP